MFDVIWAGPDEGPAITLVYRRRGETETLEFEGPVLARSADRKTLGHCPREKLPLKDGKFDLRRMPVIVVGGHARKAWNRMVHILRDVNFRGAVLICPGTGNWDMDSGKLVLSDAGLLDPAVRVQGPPLPPAPDNIVGWEEVTVAGGFNCSRYLRRYVLWYRDGTRGALLEAAPRYKGLRRVSSIGCLRCSRVGLEYRDGTWFTGEHFAQGPVDHHNAARTTLCAACVKSL